MRTPTTLIMAVSSIWLQRRIFEVLFVNNLQNSNTHIISFQNNIDTTSKTPKTTPSPSTHIEAVSVLRCKMKIFYAYWVNSL